VVEKNPTNGKRKLTAKAMSRIKKRFNSISIPCEFPDKIAQGRVTYITT